jgi:hypothetical protein
MWTSCNGEIEKPCVYVDVQGFKINKNRFMCKEFCLIDGDETFHAIVKPWFPHKKLLGHYKRQVTWLEQHFHGIKYEEGDIDINELTETVYPKLVDKVIIVKGEEKIQWLKYIFREYGDVIVKDILDYELDMLDEPSELEYRNNMCEYHSYTVSYRSCRCAMANAVHIREIMEQN